MFTQGYQIGLKPEEVLDLEYWQFLCCVEGYRYQVNGEVANAVIAGYYSAYYSNSKHPEKPTNIIKKLLLDDKNTSKTKGANNAQIDMAEKIAEFEAREARFRERGLK